MSDRRIETRVVHAGLDPDPTYGSVIPPIHQTSTYVQPSPGEFVEDYDYARSANPTRAALERAIGELEGGLGSAFSSGMAATHALITARCSAGDHVVLPSDLYGGTYRLVDKVLKRFGLEYDMVDQTDLDALAAAVRPETRLIWVETPTNPLLNVVDVAAVVERKQGAIVAVDNTFATPIVQRPLELGADAVVHSATKYLGGHSDVVGGALVVDDEKLRAQLAHYQNTIGGTPGPLDCFLVLRGTKTLHLRMQRHCENAARVAAALERHERVDLVHYPGLPSHPQHALAQRQMRAAGGMVSFELKASVAEATRVASSFRVFALAESLGGVESLVDHPASMTHASIPRETRIAAGLNDGLIRLSVGVEDVEDLLADVERALSVLR